MRTYIYVHGHICAKYTHHMPPAMQLRMYTHSSRYADMKRVIVFTRNIATQCFKSLKLIPAKSAICPIH